MRYFAHLRKHVDARVKRKRENTVRDRSANGRREWVVRVSSSECGKCMHTIN